MEESAGGDGEFSMDRTSRRGALRAVAGAGAVGVLGAFAGCEEGIGELQPAGQTVAYKTPQGELRDGTMGGSIVNETETPYVKPEVDTDHYLASVEKTRGKLSLSPDATKVAYVDANGNGIGTAIAIQSLSGGGAKHSRSDLQDYWGSALQSIAHGNLLSVDWCPTSGSDKLAMTVDGWTELDGQLLFEFDTGSESVHLFDLDNRPDIFAPNMAWSPSCDRIAYKQDPGRRGESAPLTVLNAGTGDNTQRVENGEDPAWGDTGIAFVRDGDVYLDRQSGLVQLTDSSATDSNPVIFEQAPGESLAFQRDNELHLIERIDQFGSDPNPSPAKVATDERVTTFDIVD